MPYSPQIAFTVDLPACKTESNQPETAPEKAPEIAPENAEVAEESANLGRPSTEAAQVGAEPRNTNIARTTDPFDLLDIA